jgi:hypothetical protein
MKHFLISHPLITRGESVAISRPAWYVDSRLDLPGTEELIACTEPGELAVEVCVNLADDDHRIPLLYTGTELTEAEYLVWRDARIAELPPEPEGTP